MNCGVPPPVAKEAAVKSFNPMPFVIIGGACIAGIMKVDLITLAIITGAVTIGVLAARLMPKQNLR
jgi:hypothetical protein